VEFYCICILYRKKLQQNRYCRVSGRHRNDNGGKYFSDVTLCCWACNLIVLVLLDPEDGGFMILCVVEMAKFHVPEDLNILSMLFYDAASRSYYVELVMDR
jgi:hypothetical protein